MRTKTIEIEETNYLIAVEVTRTGEIFEAQAYLVHMEATPIECTNQVKESKYYRGLVKQKFDELDWNDHGDDGYEQYRETLGLLREGLKPA